MNKISTDSAHSADPLISVVIPVYNVADYLRECLDSILTQDYQNIEVICADDCSKDASPQILTEYAARDERVIPVLGKENHGCPYARNRCLERAHGKYVYFIDADDMLKPGAFTALVDIMEKDGLDGVLFNGDAVFETEALREKWGGASYYAKKHTYAGIMPGYELYTKILVNGDYSPSVFLQFWRRDLLTKYDITFKEYMRQMDDETFFFQMMIAAKKMRCIPQSFHLYRRREGSITTSVEDEKKLTVTFCCAMMMCSDRLCWLEKFQDEMEDSYRTYLYKSVTFAMYALLQEQYRAVRDPMSIDFPNVRHQNFFVRFREAQALRDIMPFLGRTPVVLMGEARYRASVCKLFARAEHEFIVLDETIDGVRQVAETKVRRSVRAGHLHIVFSEGFATIGEWIKNSGLSNVSVKDGRGLVPYTGTVVG